MHTHNAPSIPAFSTSVYVRKVVNVHVFSVLLVTYPPQENKKQTQTQTTKEKATCLWNICASQKGKEMKAKKQSEEYTLSGGKAAAMKVDNYSNPTPGSQKFKNIASLMNGLNTIIITYEYKSLNSLI